MHVENVLAECELESSPGFECSGHRPMERTDAERNDDFARGSHHGERRATSGGQTTANRSNTVAIWSSNTNASRSAWRTK